MDSLPTGQWMGQFDGPFPGFATLSVESDRPNRPLVCIIQGNGIPGTRVELNLEVSGNSFEGVSTSIMAFDTASQELVSPQEMARRLEGRVAFSDRIQITNGRFEAGNISGNWSGDQNRGGTFSLKNPMEGLPSQADLTLDWPQFKEHVAKMIREGATALFRGQISNQWPLQTSFHRNGRFDLLRYNQTVSSELVHRINAVSQYQYDLTKPLERGGLLSLAQHHGFPTPLLDWSLSPYVAAYFAFESKPQTKEQNHNPRIFVLTSETWMTDTPQVTHLDDPTPHLTVMEFPAHNNPRHLPQQSVHTFSNVSSIEGWIRLMEKRNGKRYLTTIDIKATDRSFAIKDLAYMGVTAASLFPGLWPAPNS